jgi:gentisate 1,2-dioxygenase
MIETASPGTDNMINANQEWLKPVTSWEYSSAAKPAMHPIPIHAFPATLHESGQTQIIELDLSAELETAYPATTPGLLANYIHLCVNETIRTTARSTSEVFYVMRGCGRTETTHGILRWQPGDVFTLPCNEGAIHEAHEDAALYWVHDAPLLRYLGAVPLAPRFHPAFYPAADLQQQIETIRHDGSAQRRNRNGIILGNRATEKTRTLSHSMWSLYNLLPAGEQQAPHRHYSAAIDLAVTAQAGVYTLIAKKIDAQGRLLDPIRMDWQPNSVFVTPPGWWHSHHNESDQDAYVFPVQDAGVHIYLRTLDIQFSKPSQ